MESSEFDQNALEKIPRFLTPSFRFWVQRKMKNSERKTSENWFSEVSDFTENSEFSTSPNLGVDLACPVTVDQKIYQTPS